MEVENLQEQLLRKCSSCKINKTHSNFVKCKNKKYGIGYTCYDCKNKSQMSLQEIINLAKGDLKKVSEIIDYAQSSENNIANMLNKLSLEKLKYIAKKQGLRGYSK